MLDLRILKCLGLLLSCAGYAVIAILAYPIPIGAVALFSGAVFAVIESFMLLRRCSFTTFFVVFFHFHVESASHAILAYFAMLADNVSRSLAARSLAIYRRHNPNFRAEPEERIILKGNGWEMLCPPSLTGSDIPSSLDTLTDHPYAEVRITGKPPYGRGNSPHQITHNTSKSDVSRKQSTPFSFTESFRTKMLPVKLIEELLSPPRAEKFLNLHDVSEEISLLPHRLFRFIVDLCGVDSWNDMNFTIPASAGHFFQEGDDQLNDFKAYISTILRGHRQPNEASLKIDDCLHHGCLKLEHGRSLIGYTIKELQHNGLLGKLKQLHLTFPRHYNYTGSIELYPSPADITELEHFYWEGDLLSFPEPWCSLSNVAFSNLVTVSLLHCKISLHDCVAILCEAVGIVTFEVDEIEDMPSIMKTLPNSHAPCSKLENLHISSANDIHLSSFFDCPKIDLQNVRHITLSQPESSVVNTLWRLPWRHYLASVNVKTPLSEIDLHGIITMGITFSVKVYYYGKLQKLLAI